MKGTLLGVLGFILQPNLQILVLSTIDLFHTLFFLGFEIAAAGSTEFGI